MPQMSFWPFMARTMVEDMHGVKPLPFAAAASPPEFSWRSNGMRGRVSLPFAAGRESLSSSA